MLSIERVLWMRSSKIQVKCFFLKMYGKIGQTNQQILATLAMLISDLCLLVSNSMRPLCLLYGFLYFSSIQRDRLVVRHRVLSKWSQSCTFDPPMKLLKTTVWFILPSLLFFVCLFYSERVKCFTASFHWLLIARSRNLFLCCEFITKLK